ncbi:MAG: transcription-repair coupling factor [Gammaproteobacteria bacterium]|nr:transcription-repair coupling factor [Gammaproteobacteria bacterium]
MQTIFLQPKMPLDAGDIRYWSGLNGSASSLAISHAAAQHDGPIVLVTTDAHAMERLQCELHFYLGDQQSLPVTTFPDWETLPYDTFSPHPDTISERLTTLSRLPQVKKGVVITSITTLMHRLPPRRYLQANSLMLKVGEKFDMETMRQQLTDVGYRCVDQVMEHGEFSVRGSIMDLYPMGSKLPYRIDLFDEEVDTIRTFDPENQRSIERIEQIKLLPAREYPLDKSGINQFRENYSEVFPDTHFDSVIYRDVNKGLAPSGIEYYLPLFFEESGTLFDYMPPSTLVLLCENAEQIATTFWQETKERYEQHRYDPERPLLPPERMFLQVNEAFAGFRHYPRVQLRQQATSAATQQFATSTPPNFPIDSAAAQPTAALATFLDEYSGRALIVAESAGRREALLELLRQCTLKPTQVDGWHDFLQSDQTLAITIAPLDAGLLIDNPTIAIITEQQLFGEHAMQRRRRQSRGRDTDSNAIIKNLNELRVNAPVVHEEHGVGRYLGMQALTVGEIEREFLTLEYAGGDKLYVPVSSLHLINRYSGSDPDHAPLHKLGSEQWQKARQRAAKRVRDVAAELLEIYAQRAARKGHIYRYQAEQYSAFASAFPFEETPDQLSAINAVVADMRSDKPMDRLVCGDVGFGKTEVAMRAAFVATQDTRQVAVLVPTTLLAQQHYENFKDRFADWPVRVELLSRFRTKKQQDITIEAIENGKVDIVIGTHKLLQGTIKFKELGLMIIDEEHRFGVRQKERVKALRAEVDVLTLTATPIPRTLNMALADLRDLSIIATPPARRVAIKTFVREWNEAMLREAMLREIKRGGQIYFLHNEVQTIEKMAVRIKELLPEVTIGVAHGQMRERELERVMLDFYHRRFNVLLCTTIIESGIDVPTANTIIIHRADKLGLAQLYQLRGRVGRSHHSSYAYLIVPSKGAMTGDAQKRLDAIASLEELGAGFTLATNDMEIRGTGELLGDEQSGHIHEIGFSMYMELLERAVESLKSGEQPTLESSAHHATEVDLNLSALIPADYLPDVHTRLVIYKRIANAAGEEALRELRVEMIDRFGLLPEATENLLQITHLKLRAAVLGIEKIDAGAKGGSLLFGANPNIDQMAVINLIQIQPHTYRLDGANKLRLTQDLPDSQSRIKSIEKILDKLCPSKNGKKETKNQK